MDKNKYGKLFFINRNYMLYMMENIGEVIYFYVDYVVVFNMLVRVLFCCVGILIIYVFELICVVID